MHFNFIFIYIDNPKSIKPTIMKQNTQFIVVIFFVTLAFLVMLNDVTNYKNHEIQNTVDVFEVNNPSSDLATTDLEVEE